MPEGMVDGTLFYIFRYWLNICEGVHSELQSDKCTPRAAACRKTPSGIIDTLGLISTQTLTMDGKYYFVFVDKVFLCVCLSQFHVTFFCLLY
jgi:hypothetical protein